MRRNRWRALRALRVLLACIVLWLPARAVGASVAPADAVVMIAAAARGPVLARTAGEGSEVTKRRSSTAVAARARRTIPALEAGRRLRIAPPGAIDDLVVPRRYLRHCALLC